MQDMPNNFARGSKVVQEIIQGGQIEQVFEGFFFGFGQWAILSCF